MNNETTDKLDALLRAHGVKDDVKTPENVQMESDVDNIDIDNDDILFAPNKPTNEINYGDNDADEEMAREDARIEAIKRAAIEKQRAEDAKEPKYFTPPNEKDMDYNAEAIGFQSEKLAIVTTMVNKVISKYHIVSGSVPDVGPNNVTKMMVMGELIDVYHETGETITPRFERVLLYNWILPGGKRAIDCVNEEGIVNDGLVEPGEADNRPLAEFSPVVININVDGDTPVTVNVDKELVSEINESNRVDINVVHVTKQEMKQRKIVYNSEMKGIIKPHDSGVNDVPITLPVSGYRCTMKGVSWFDFLKLSTSPQSGNATDNELKKWSVIYKHISNVSIGDFESFEDFLKKTKFKDRDLLLWGVLCASSKSEEEMVLTCGNPDCGEKMKKKYSPRNLIHVDFDKTPLYYKDAYEAAAGQDAIDIWKRVNDEHDTYQLPTSHIEIEFEQPSAYDYIYKKIPLIDKIYKRYAKDGNMQDHIRNDDMAEANILVIMALCISAVYVIDEQKDITYCYNTWDTIEKVITEALDTDDSGILINLVQQINEDDNGISFYVENIDCPKCGRHDDKVMIDDIAEMMLFHLSRRLANTKINLIRNATN